MSRWRAPCGGDAGSALVIASAGTDAGTRWWASWRTSRTTGSIGLRAPRSTIRTRSIVPDRLRYLYIAIRSSTSAEAVISAVRREVSAIDATLPITEVRTMEEVLADAQSKPRFPDLGAHAVRRRGARARRGGDLGGGISYSVKQRTDESRYPHGTGAQHRKVVGLVVGRGLLLVISPRSRSPGSTRVDALPVWDLLKFGVNGDRSGYVCGGLGALAGIAILVLHSRTTCDASRSARRPA